MRKSVARNIIRGFRTDPTGSGYSDAQIDGAYTRVGGKRPSSEDVLQEKNVSALKALAKAHRKKGYSKLGKGDLIALLTS